MDIDQRILNRLDELEKLGDAVKQTLYQTSAPDELGRRVDAEKASAWGASCLSILSRVFGPNSDHYAHFNRLFPSLDHYEPFMRALGILRSAKAEYEGGYLFNARILIQAEVFDDFLEQAEHLLGTGYYAPAAVVAGSVLEDGLRKLCTRAEIELPDKPKLDWMNTELAKRGIYSKLVQKEIIALAELRNRAAHGKWDQSSDADVKSMISRIRSFMVSHFS